MQTHNKNHCLLQGQITCLPDCIHTHAKTHNTLWQGSVITQGGQSPARPHPSCSTHVQECVRNVNQSHNTMCQAL
jgi:hypothetical protein